MKPYHGMRLRLYCLSPISSSPPLSSLLISLFSLFFPLTTIFSFPISSEKYISDISYSRSDTLKQSVWTHSLLRSHWYQFQLLSCFKPQFLCFRLIKVTEIGWKGLTSSFLIAASALALCKFSQDMMLASSVFALQRYETFNQNSKFNSFVCAHWINCSIWPYQIRQPI